MSVTIEQYLKEILGSINQKLDNLQKDVMDIKIVQARLEEKVDSLEKDIEGVKLGFKTLIKPRAEKVKSHLKKLGEVVNSQKSSPQVALIKRLNPIIRGWSNYYSSVVSSKTFTDCDYYFFEKLKRWAYRRHPMKNKTWIMRKYWHTEGKDNWVFSTREGKNPFKLARHLYFARLQLAFFTQGQ